MELTTKIFAPADQARFAALSGDRNPIHLDAVAARRTQMGAPIVHGVHAVLWSLEEVSRVEPFSAAGLKVNFAAPIHVGKAATVHLLSRSDTGLKLAVVADGVLAVAIDMELGRPRPAGHRREELLRVVGPARPADWPRAPVERGLGELGPDEAGAFAFAHPVAELAAEFPALCCALSPERVGTMLALSRLVGMIAPGLHSILKDFVLDFAEEGGDAEILHYAPLDFERRFRLLRMRIFGPGAAGEVSAFARVPPVAQPSMADIAARVPKNAYAGAQVLVIGGSRGLGEVAAKACAAGGADVVLTYCLGRGDARRVAAEIAEHGGRCSTRSFDVEGDIGGQCAGMTPPTHLYYCASPPVARRRAGNFDASVLAKLMAVYATGFHETCRTLARPGQTLRAFYPSSDFVGHAPRGWTEYAMAKAAGEVLCQAIERHLAGVQVLYRRLPQLLTDQTASVLPGHYAPVLDVMLPHVAEMQVPDE